jgi:hypothetical protein
MTVEAAPNDRGRHGYFSRGNDVARRGREAKAARISALAIELASSYGGFEALNLIDANRVRLAAKLFITAEDCRDPNQCTRSTRAAELLLSKIAPKEAPLPSLQELLEAS